MAIRASRDGDAIFSCVAVPDDKIIVASPDSVGTNALGKYGDVIVTALSKDAAITIRLSEEQCIHLAMVLIGNAAAHRERGEKKR